MIDACVMINLLATAREVELTQALGVTWLMTAQTHGEALFLHSPPDDDGRRERRPAGVEALEQAGLLAVRPLETRWLSAFVRCAEHLPDPDASALALAGSLGVPLATDDRKERRVARQLFPEIPLCSTLALLRRASLVATWDRTAWAKLAFDMRWRGNFLPSPRDPDREWYEALLDSA